jgi:YVTN family beta-propeller protein
MGPSQRSVRTSYPLFEYGTDVHKRVFYAHSTIVELTEVNVWNAPYEVAVNPETNKIYIANIGSNDLIVIDGVDKTTTQVATRTNPNAVAAVACILYRSNGQEAFFGS